MVNMTFLVSVHLGKDVEFIPEMRPHIEQIQYFPMKEWSYEWLVAKEPTVYHDGSRYSSLPKLERLYLWA